MAQYRLSLNVSICTHTGDVNSLILTETQGTCILPTDVNSLTLTEMLANRDCQHTTVPSGHVYLNSSTAYSASREGICYHPESKVQFCCSTSLTGDLCSPQAPALLLSQGCMGLTDNIVMQVLLSQILTNSY